MATVIGMMDWSSTVYYNRNRLLGCLAAQPPTASKRYHRQLNKTMDLFKVNR
jgi:hypothetical protein